MNPDAPAAGKWKVMVIPALREASNLDMIDACIADEGPNETIFLGNYFDEVAGDHAGVESARRMARWLKRSVSQSRRIHLMGGRDLPDLLSATAILRRGRVVATMGSVRWLFAMYWGRWRT